ncbi:MAG: two-component system response regulator [Desulfuromonadales bacterium GWD2_61_12]|nr:MAG: two-component system response regulator [Desulfuromonadales bacterium GWD2_61_12]OGR33528.1 MAG: two-component system response regulator [Desulfuromonadales bacterium GWC2_61_20]HAD03231.1 two-component system response regulator [Desulfuromonas sp.]HBT83104.1 two-component system response regulator [Desulfuromonas sp.]
MDAAQNVNILLVEDNPQDAELAIRSLRKGGLGNGLFHVEDGAEALDFLFCRGAYQDRTMAQQPKTILLDLKLPKVDGLDVLRALKSDERTRAIPVVIVTSSREDPDIKTAYNLGANSYVVKPVNCEDFSAAMLQLGLYWLLLNQPPQ